MFETVSEKFTFLAGSISRDLATVRNCQEKGRFAAALFTLENLVNGAAGMMGELMDQFRAETESKPGYLLARDIQALYMDLDPYGADAARDFDESDEHFMFRISAEVCDDLEAMRGELEELEEMAGDTPEYSEKIKALKTRLENLEG